QLGQLPYRPRIIDPALRPLSLFIGADLEPVLHEQDAVIDHRLLNRGYQLEEPPGLFLGTETHDPLDPGTVVPAAVEDDDLAGRRKVRKVALHVHLRLLAFRRRGQRNDPEHARADALGYRLNRPALTGRVSTFEHDAHLRARSLHPLLHRHQLAVQAAQLVLILLVLHLRARLAGRGLSRDRGRRGWA